MSFFKAYDMRGTFGVDFDLDVVYKAGLHLPAIIRKKNAEAASAAEDAPFRVLVGRDARVSSPSVAAALIAGLAAAGAQVTDLGPATTPMVYFFTAEEDFDASVMVTASHNPPSDNGLKVSVKTALPVGYKDGLDKVEAIVNGLS
jgi:phosphomannomutase